MNFLEKVMFLQQEIAERLLERLDFVKVQPQVILDYSACQSITTELIKKRYTETQVVASKGMTEITSNTYNMIFSNLFLQDSTNLEETLTSLRQFLQPNGFLLFSLFGPDTLKEIKFELNLIDMHHIGDILLQAGFQDPVVDMEYLTLQYKNVENLWRDLNLKDIPIDSYQATKIENYFPATFEIIYGIAWAGESDTVKTSDEVVIPLDKISRKRS